MSEQCGMTLTMPKTSSLSGLALRVSGNVLLPCHHHRHL